MASALLLLAMAIFTVAQAQITPSWMKGEAQPVMDRTRPSGPFPANKTSNRWLPLPAAGGPFLRFSGRSGDTLTYSVMVFVAADSSAALRGTNLRVVPSAPVKIRASKPTVLFSFSGYTFIRWVVKVDLNRQIPAKTYISYTVTAAQGLFPMATNTFVIPGYNSTWNWSYNSCNGFHDLTSAPVGGIEPLWADIMSLQASRPLHLMVSDGDQLYNDAVLEDIPELANISETDDFKKVLAWKWTDDVKIKTHFWLMSHYIYHWSVISESYTKALASIPFIMSWDDHELFNGFGSWPDFLQASDFFMGYKGLAETWYLIFQHHSTPELLMEDLKWNVEADSGSGSGGLNWFSMLDSYTAILLPDLRYERNQSNVLTKATQSAIMDKISKDATPHLAHLILASSNPLVYNIEQGVEAFLFKPTGALDLKPFGLSNTIKDLQLATLSPAGAPLVAALKPVFGMKFGVLDLSDLFDNWDSRTHREERAAMVGGLQAWGDSRKARVTFIGGDSHLGYSGRFYNPAFVGRIEDDPHWSFVVTSSAIGNNPADALVPGLEAAALSYSAFLDGSNTTKAVLNPIYSMTAPVAFATGPVNYIMPARNYLRGQVDLTSGKMVIEHRFELKDAKPPSNTTSPWKAAAIATAIYNIPARR